MIGEAAERYGGQRFRPIKVALLDLERLPQAIGDDGRYGSLWAMVREHGRPRGMIRVPFSDDELKAEDLRVAIAALPSVGGDAAPLRRAGVPLPAVSVVVPSMFERREALAACVASLAGLDYPDYEVIVVDNRRGDGDERQVADDLPGARVIHEPRPGTSAARNAGLAAARGEIIAYVDDDVVVDPAWLLAIVHRLLDHPEEACVTGLALPAALETPAQVGIEEYYGGFGPRVYESAGHRMPQPGTGRARLTPATVEATGDDGRALRSFSLYATGSLGLGANMAFRTAVLRELGGFDIALGPGTPSLGGEDLEVFARLLWAGHGLGFEPAALVHHRHRDDALGLERQIRGYGLGYTALLTALVARDPRHLGRILATGRRAARLMLADFRGKLAGGEGDSDGGGADHAGARNRELARIELRGMAAGPGAYLRSRWRTRR